MVQENRYKSLCVLCAGLSDREWAYVQARVAGAPPLVAATKAGYAKPAVWGERLEEDARIQRSITYATDVPHDAFVARLIAFAWQDPECAAPWDDLTATLGSYAEQDRPEKAQGKVPGAFTDGDIARSADSGDAFLWLLMVLRALIQIQQLPSLAGLVLGHIEEFVPLASRPHFHKKILRISETRVDELLTYGLALRQADGRERQAVAAAGAKLFGARVGRFLVRLLALGQPDAKMLGLVLVDG